MLKKKRLKKPIIRSVLLTSLPAFLVAEIFFAGIYFLFNQIVQGIYFLFALRNTANIEANMQIFSVVNIGFFLVALFVMSIIMALEIATIIAITIYDWYRNDHIPLKKLFQFSYERLKIFLHWRALPFLFLIFFFPKEHIGPKWLLSLEIPPYILEEIVKFPLYFFGVILIFGAIAYVIYRSIFIIHYLLLERTTLSRAFKLSFSLTKKIGYKRMIGILLQNIFWILLFVLPILAISEIISRYSAHIAHSLGDWTLPIVGLLDWLSNFLFTSLPWVLFLAGLTIAYIRYSGFHKNHFEKRFHLLSKEEFTPRWQNVRRAFQKKYPVLIMSILLILAPFFWIIIVDSESRIQKHIAYISHRGVSNGDFIENTIPAILEAKKQGATMVEIDIYENADGTLILSHDSDLSRIAGVKTKISDLKNADLEKIILPNNTKIPTLEEVLQIAKKENILLLIEPKIHGKEKNLYPNLVRLIEENEMIKNVYIHSFSLDSLDKIKKLQPHLKVGQLIFGGFGQFGAMNVDFFSIQETLLTRSMIDDIHRYEKKIFVWTVNDESRVEKYLKMGVDGFITDDIPAIKSASEKILGKNILEIPNKIHIFGTEFSREKWKNFWSEVRFKFEK